MINSRAKTLWLPGLLSMTGSMAWRMILQRTVTPSQKLLNHAGLPLTLYVLWLAALPLFGAASAYLSRKAGGTRSNCLMAALFPSIVMVPLWMALAINMSHPSPRQWFGLLSGVLNWIVIPGAVLLLGALPIFRAKLANDKENTPTRIVNARTATFWLPALASLAVAMVGLSISTRAGLQPRFVANGMVTLVVYVPWLLLLPICGGAGAFLSRRAGGERLVRLAAGLFPVIALTSVVGFLTLIGKFAFARPQLFYVSVGVLFGVILPGAFLLLGIWPFVRAELQKS